MLKNKRYLLIISCSKRKKTNLLKAPAIELYDGPFYKILRKCAPSNLDVLIISAKYGLISANEIIELYDLKMTPKRAVELAPYVRSRLESWLSKWHYEKIFIMLGKVYMSALNDSWRLLENYDIEVGRGQIGERLHTLKKWLKILGGCDE